MDGALTFACIQAHDHLKVIGTIHTQCIVIQSTVYFFHVQWVYHWWGGRVWVWPSRDTSHPIQLDGSTCCDNVIIVTHTYMYKQTHILSFSLSHTHYVNIWQNSFESSCVTIYPISCQETVSLCWYFPLSLQSESTTILTQY